MKLCMPSVGALMVLTEDWKINMDEMNLQAQYSCLDYLENPPKITTKMELNNWDKKQYPIQYYTGELVLPKGTLLKIIDITFWSIREKSSHKVRKDSIRIEILETSLPYKVDKKVILTPHGRISKKKRERPCIWLELTPDQAATCEFEFGV